MARRFRLRKGRQRIGSTGMASVSGRASMMDLVGDQELALKLLHLSDSAVNKIMAPAIRKGLTVARREAKNLVPVRTGALQSAIAMRARASKKSGKVVGMLYIRRDKKTEYKGKPHDPAKIAHLVEFGTKKAKPKSFLRQAIANKRVIIQANIRMKAREAFQIQANRLASKALFR